MIEVKQRNPVREVRSSLRLTQSELAEQLGCGETSVRRYEREGRLPDNRAVMKQLRALAQSAGVALPE